MVIPLYVLLIEAGVFQLSVMCIMQYLSLFLCSMPFLKTQQTTAPLVKVWDKKAQKCGLHHTIYSVNGDQYRGEWWDNKKHGNTFKNEHI